MPHPIFAATVLFSGLILHYEMNPSTHQKTALLVKAPDHTTPRILVPVRGAYVSSSGMAFTTGADFMEFKLPADKQYLVVTTNMSGGVSVQPEFEQRVPHLPDILKVSATIHADIAAGKLYNAHASVSYANGKLSTQRCFEDAIHFEFQSSAQDRCLAEAVRLDITTGDNWEIREVGGSGNTIVLLPNAEVNVENAAPSEGHHELHYSKLLAAGGQVYKMLRSAKCDQNTCAIVSVNQPAAPPSRPMSAGKRQKGQKGHGHGHGHGARQAQPASGPFNPKVECSNTQWP